MNLKDIVVKNQEFNKWSKGLEEDIKVKKETLKALNATQFNIEEFKELSYEKAKEVFEVLKHNIDFGEQYKQLECALAEIKLNTFEILKVAHYYPSINNLSYLTDTQKHDVDKLLYRIKKGGFIHRGSSGWYGLRLSKEVEEKLLNDLYNLGITERYYKLTCSHCGQWSEVVSEEQYLNNKKIFEIIDKQKENKATDEEIEWCEDMMDKGERVWDVTCLECSDEFEEIESFAQLESKVSPIYKISKLADLTYAQK